MIDTNYNNRPKNMDLTRVSSPMLEFGDPNHDPHMKIDDDLSKVNLAEATTLPQIWNTIPHNISSRSYSHDSYPIGSGATSHPSSTGTPPLGHEFSMGFKTQYPMNNTQALSPLAMQKPIPSEKNHRKIVKPRIATIFWEEENTTCYQVRTENVVVSRREDNDYINGTKLLNVTGMTRGKRDGMLKIEKGRKVIRNGLMNLKGVWIPFERAMEIARNEGVDHLLYPLFVRDIRRAFQQSEKFRHAQILDEEEDHKLTIPDDDAIHLGASSRGLSGYPRSYC